jgi:hypothetical protein
MYYRAIKSTKSTPYESLAMLFSTFYSTSTSENTERKHFKPKLIVGIIVEYLE